MGANSSYVVRSRTTISPTTNEMLTSLKRSTHVTRSRSDSSGLSFRISGSWNLNRNYVFLCTAQTSKLQQNIVFSESKQFSAKLSIVRVMSNVDLICRNFAIFLKFRKILQQKFGSLRIIPGNLEI